MNGDEPLLGITMGDPAGIGPEIIGAGHGAFVDHGVPVVFGDASVVHRGCQAVGVDRSIRVVDRPADATSDVDTIDVVDFANVTDHEWGVISAANGRASLEYVEAAIDAAMDATIDAMVTAPIHKQAIAAAGSTHTGHTGLIGAKTNVTEYSMLLLEEPLRVSHVSTHVPLREACERVTTERVEQVIHMTHDAVERLGIPTPRVAVAGLNPHAGDGGVLGHEEDQEIRPAVENARHAGVDAIGPISGDTIFTRALGGDVDCIVAMYHDQGHIPVKLRGFHSDGAVTGVNVTIGVPIVRTSVDHGTAFDIAGTGTASSRSLEQACEVAAHLVQHE